MAQTPYAAGFHLIASEDADPTSDNPRERAKQIAEINELKAFADELRKNIRRDEEAADGAGRKTAPLPATAAAPATN